MAGVRTKVRWWWARTWWVPVPLVSCGLLAFVPSLLAWWRTRERGWLRSAFVYFLIPWGAALVEDAAGWSNRTLGLILFGTAIVAFGHALAVRRSGYVRPFRPPHDPQGFNGGGLTAAIGVGVAAVAGAVVAVLSGPHVDLAAVCLLGAAGVFGLLPQFLSRPERPPVLGESGGGSALLFTYRKWGVRSAVVGVGLVWFALIVGAVSRWDEIDLYYKGVAILSLATVPWIAGPVARLNAGPLLALTPRGIAGRFPTSVTFVPWTAVADIGVIETGRWATIVVAASDPTEVEKDFLERVKETFQTYVGPDAAYPVRGLDADFRAVVRTLRHYWENPADRAELGSPASLETYERIRRSAEAEQPAAPSRP